MKEPMIQNDLFLTAANNLNTEQLLIILQLWKSRLSVYDSNDQIREQFEIKEIYLNGTFIEFRIDTEE